MDSSSILQIVGQVAGIGGISLGILLLLFREVIRKNIFPHLAPIQGYRLMRLIVLLTFLIATIGLGAWVYVRAQESNRLSKSADITSSLKLINETLQDIQQSLHQFFSSFASTFIVTMESLRRDIRKTSESSLTPNRPEAPSVAASPPAPAVQDQNTSLPEGKVIEGRRRHVDWPSVDDAGSETSDQGRRQHGERPKAADTWSEARPDNTNISPKKYEPQEQSLVHTPSPSPQAPTLSPPSPITRDVNPTPAKAVRLERTRTHLNLIANFAESVCKEPWLAIPRDTLKLSDKAEAKLHELIKNLADLRVKKAVNYDRLDYQDFFQKDLAVIRYMSLDCISTTKKYVNNNLIRNYTKPIRYSQKQEQEKYVFDLQYCGKRGKFVNCSFIIYNKGKRDGYPIWGTSRIVDSLDNEVLVSEVILGDKRQKINKYSFIDNDVPSYGILKANLYFYSINPEANSMETLEIHSREHMASVRFKNIELLDTKESLEVSAPTNGMPAPQNLTVISLTQ